MVTQIGDDIWRMDGPDIVFAGASMHTRMFVVRLQDQGLWVHSPIALSDDVYDFLAEIGGEVAVLVAPNKFHYLYIESWRQAFPQAKLFAEEELVKKVTTLGDAEILTNVAPKLYADDIDQVIFGGNRMFIEAVFFHKASRSLIFTDLMINLKTDRINLLGRLFLKFEGVTYPNGGIPRLYRWFSNDKNKARLALSTIKKWNPTQVHFCHGEAFNMTAQELIEREFAYLDAPD